MIYAYALGNAAEIAEKCGRSGLAGEYRERKASLIRAINAHCYDKEKGMYADVPGRKIFSRHTTIWAVLASALEGEAARELIERTFAYGDVSDTTFSMNYFTFRALEKTGLYEKYAPEVFGGWKKMLELHCTTWCENPDSPRSECHAWSSAPAYELSAIVLGIYPTSDGYDTVRIKPNASTLEIDWAKGAVSTPLGEIAVDWKKENGIFSLKVSLPEGVTATIELPSGKTFEMTSTAEEFSCNI
jgi:hypothetical protein